MFGVHFNIAWHNLVNTFQIILFTLVCGRIYEERGIPLIQNICYFIQLTTGRSYSHQYNIEAIFQSQVLR